MGADFVKAALAAGADAIATAEQKVAELKAPIEANRDLSTSLAFDRAAAIETRAGRSNPVGPTTFLRNPRNITTSRTQN